MAAAFERRPSAPPQEPPPRKRADPGQIPRSLEALRQNPEQQQNRAGRLQPLPGFPRPGAPKLNQGLRENGTCGEFSCPGINRKSEN